MGIHKHHPSYIDFVKKELLNLQFLFNDKYIANSFTELSNSAYTFHSIYGFKKDGDLKNIDFSFGCNFDIVIEKKKRKIAVEALITPEFKHVSYSLSICDKKKCLRKFHFDYAIPIANDPKLKPIYHLQYGGEQSPQLKNLNISVKQIYPWLSSPRINFMPVNLAILLDMIFCEFPSEITNGVVQRSEWRDFIKNNEEYIIKPFYKRMEEFISKEHSSDKLVRDFYYGKK